MTGKRAVIISSGEVVPAEGRRDLVIPVGGTSFTVGDDETHLSFLSVAAALEGDTRRLYARLQSGVALSQNERDFLAGKLKRVSNRPPKRSARNLQWGIASLVHYCRHLGGWKTEAAVNEAMATFGVSRRAVFEAVKEVKKEPGRQGLLEDNMRDKVFSEAGLDEFKRGLKGRAQTSITWSKE